MDADITGISLQSYISTCLWLKQDIKCYLSLLYSQLTAQILFVKIYKYILDRGNKDEVMTWGRRVIRILIGKKFIGVLFFRQLCGCSTTPLGSITSRCSQRKLALFPEAIAEHVRIRFFCSLSQLDNCH